MDVLHEGASEHLDFVDERRLATREIGPRELYFGWARMVWRVYVSPWIVK